MKVLTFKVEIKGLEDKIWRKIEITDGKTIAELVYTILASFDSLAYHLYEIMIGEDYYSCDMEKTIKIKLKDISFNNKKIILTYDMGASTIFIINYLESHELEKGNGRHYPYVIAGLGKGMIDDISGDELKEKIENNSMDIYYTPGYERTVKYNYLDYSLKNDNILLKSKIDMIKDDYEKSLNEV